MRTGHVRLPHGRTENLWFPVYIGKMERCTSETTTVGRCVVTTKNKEGETFTEKGTITCRLSQYSTQRVSD